MNNKNNIYAVKYLTYAVILFFFYIIQTTPHFLNISGIKPNLVIPVAVCIAMFEGEFIGGLFGAFGGMLCDLSASSAFGFYSILLLILCTTIGLLVIYLMKNSIINAFFFTSATVAIVLLLDFFFMFGLWGYEGITSIFLYKTIPTIIYSSIMVPVFYFIFSKLFALFESKVRT